MRRTSILLMSAAVLAAMTACTPTGAAPSSSESPDTSPTPTASSAADPFTIAGCETLLPIERARSIMSDSVEFLGERPLNQFTGWFEVPAITAGLTSAEQGILCSWGVPNSDGIVLLHVVEITPETRTEIEAALPGAGFTTVTMGTVTAYEAEREDALSTLAATHLFTGDVWIMGNANTLSASGEMTGSALDALRTANPTLGL